MAILVTQMVPGIVIANSLYRTYSTLHLLDSYVGLILADASLGIPFAILIMRSFMFAIPLEILEAARVDRASAAREPCGRSSFRSAATRAHQPCSPFCSRGVICCSR